jgi:hypothetical protein
MSEQVTQEQSAPETQQPAPELNINDLAAMRSLIEVVSQRGAFKAAELSGVGMLFDKLNTFLDAVAKQQHAAQPKQPEQGQGE